MKTKKKKHIVRIISPHSEHYISTNDEIIDLQLNPKQNILKQKNVDRKSIKDLKKSNHDKIILLFMNNIMFILITITQKYILMKVNFKVYFTDMLVFLTL